MSPFPLCLSPLDAVISSSSLTLLHWLLEARDPPEPHISGCLGWVLPQPVPPGQSHQVLHLWVQVGQVGWAEPVLPAPGLHPGLLCLFRRWLPDGQWTQRFSLWGRGGDLRTPFSTTAAGRYMLLKPRIPGSSLACSGVGRMVFPVASSGDVGVGCESDPSTLPSCCYSWTRGGSLCVCTFHSRFFLTIKASVVKVMLILISH